jgi:hypothetical protein
VTQSANAPTAKNTNIQPADRPVDNGTYRFFFGIIHCANVGQFLLDRLVALGESDGAGSDYGKGCEAKLAKRRKKAGKGQAVSDTESEDAQLDRELSVEAVPETSDSHPPRTTGSKTGGGKKASQSKPVDDDELEGNEDKDEADDKWEVISRPLSKDARAEAQQLGALVAEMAEKIARKYKKSRCEVVLAAGLGVRAAHSRNLYNMFRKWYAHHHPKGESECPALCDFDGLLTCHSVIQRVRQAYD